MHKKIIHPVFDNSTNNKIQNTSLVYKKRKSENNDEIHKRTAKSRAKAASDIIEKVIEDDDRVGEHVLKNIAKNHKHLTAKVVSKELSKDSELSPEETNAFRIKNNLSGNGLSV